jgi:hypothetical protein
MDAVISELDILVIVVSLFVDGNLLHVCDYFGPTRLTKNEYRDTRSNSLVTEPDLPSRP